MKKNSPKYTKKRITFDKIKEKGCFLWNLKLSFSHKCLHNILDLRILHLIFLYYTTLTHSYLTKKEEHDLKFDKHVELVWSYDSWEKFDMVNWQTFLKIVLWHHTVSWDLRVVFWHIVFTRSKAKRLCQLQVKYAIILKI